VIWSPFFCRLLVFFVFCRFGAAEMPTRDCPCTSPTATSVLQVYRLRDACATLQLVFLASQHRVAEYVEKRASDLAEERYTVALSSSTSSPFSPASLPPSWVYVGRSSRDRCAVCLVLPTYANFFFDYTIEWALFAQAEMSRQYASRCMIAKLQTIGGGWASLHRADRALLCALQLYTVAEAVLDEEVMRKSRLFIGWAHLWNSNPAKALEVFRSELSDARARGDATHERRCLHAICNAEQNPKLAPGGSYTAHYDLVDCWSSTFA
jgi:hypothetical protein